MKKKTKRYLGLLAVMAFSLSLSSCSNSFFGGDASLQIKDVTHVYDSESGNTIVTITFMDEDTAPVTFLIPRGISGKDGVSIKNVTSRMTADGKSIELHISYSDGTIPDTVISVPVLQGKGIKEVEVNKDENGNTTIQFTYTDDTKGDVITIPKGDDGNGIESFDVVGPDRDGVTNITVTLTDGTVKEFSVQNGRDGVSVSSIAYSSEKSNQDKYALVVTYSDGYEETIYLDRPKTTRWYTGASNPDEDSMANGNAKEGDFYLNKLNGYVYLRNQDGTWTFLFGMKNDGSSSGLEVYHTVFFDPKEGKINNEDGIFMASVLDGKTISLENIPSPTYEGHKFVGWYTSLDNVNAGKFTDMTPVFDDLKLYAKYEAI